jgi:hypothetical protein
VVSTDCLLPLQLGQPSLEIVEHIALAGETTISSLLLSSPLICSSVATCRRFRSCYHNSDLWDALFVTRTVPQLGRRALPHPWVIPNSRNRVSKIFSWPQKKKAYGVYFKAIQSMYSSHRKACFKVITRNVSTINSFRGWILLC